MYLQWEPPFLRWDSVRAEAGDVLLQVSTAQPGRNARKIRMASRQGSRCQSPGDSEPPQLGVAFVLPLADEDPGLEVDLLMQVAPDVTSRLFVGNHRAPVDLGPVALALFLEAPVGAEVGQLDAGAASGRGRVRLRLRRRCCLGRCGHRRVTSLAFVLSVRLLSGTR